jgi:glycosyltransferase involved in cell wall biosynthesis
MNIGIDGRILEWKYSGIARYVQLLLTFDIFKGATVYFPGKSSIILDPKFKKKMIKTPFKRRELYEQVILPIHLAKDKIDLFIQPYNFGIPILYNGKSILIVFDIIPLIFKEYFFFARHKKWAHWNYEQNTKVAMNKATKIVTDSESAKNDLLRYFPKTSPEKIVSIYYGFKKPENVTEQSNLSKFMSSKNIKMPYILANAGLEERKNAHILIEAFAALSKEGTLKLQLVFTGFNKFYFEKLKKIVRKHSLEKMVVFTDSVSEEEKNHLIRNARVVVNPSSFEGFGIPLLEAAEFNKSIICSDIPAFKEVGLNYPIYFENNNVDSLLEKLKYFFDNEIELNAKSSSLSSQMLSRFPLSQMEEKWKTLVASIK